jgi:hypothetical protein
MLAFYCAPMGGGGGSGGGAGDPEGLPPPLVTDRLLAVDCRGGGVGGAGGFVAVAAGTAAGETTVATPALPAPCAAVVTPGVT